MSAEVFALVLFAGVLHPAWNALIKAGASKVTIMLIMTLVQGGAGLVIALTRPLPQADVFPWLLASGALHAAYKLFLAFAYERGDLSHVYPIARGAAPLFVLVVSAVFVIDPIRASETGAIALLGLGIVLMAHGAFRSGKSLRLVPLAIGSAAMTAGYSLVDGMGARVAGDAVMYVGWLFFLDLCLFTPALLVLRGPAVLRASRGDWVRGGLAAGGSYAAYAIVVWAMTQAPIALVVALRETSILFAVLIGWLVMGERMDRTKATAAVLIFAGVVVMRL